MTLPKKILEETENLAKERLEDRSTVMRELLAKGLKEHKESEAIKSYSEGKLSLGKAAEYAGISEWRFIDLLKEKKTPLRYDVDVLRKEIEKISVG